jgi:hypothetical protein
MKVPKEKIKDLISLEENEYINIKGDKRAITLKAPKTEYGKLESVIKKLIK